MLILPLSTALGACFDKSDSDAEPECIADAQCPSGHICDFEVCVEVGGDDTEGEDDDGSTSGASADGTSGPSTTGPADSSASASTTDASTTGASTTGASTSTTTGGEQCVETGYECTVNGDCCDFPDSASCVGFQEGTFCSAMCDENAACNSGCCVPLTNDGEPADYGACAPDTYCGVSTCGLAQCQYNYCGGAAEGNCPIAWFGDGECDCGCQYNDIDC
jgi:hypothetical protein